MDDDHYSPYVTVGTQKQRAAAMAQKLASEGHDLAPVEAAGRAIARTFWGQAWNRSLQSHGDYETRLPRGRSYLRSGCVLDLKVAVGRVEARVFGSRLYDVTVRIGPLARERWEAIRTRCAGQVSSLVDLLQGRLAAPVMAIMTDRDDGLFPAPDEIRFSCTCLDWADMCKHVAAALYGIGARLDEQPELLFRLRGIDHGELLQAAVLEAPPGGDAGTLAHADLESLFGFELDGE